MEEMQYELREEYRYFAFISYNHKDMAWAKWIQNKLENYRLPAQIRKKHIGLPQKIAPVFRDQTDLAGSVLEEALQRELESSQYLIVICSPNSVASEYVNDEIKHFLSLGRKRQIIPFVVDGVPFSKDPATECFPRELRSITPELLGINVQDYGRQEAFSRLVATLLRLPADEVVMRERKRTARRKTFATAAAVVLCAILGALGWYNTEHSSYYNAYTYRYEVPVGLYELSDAQRASTSDCYRITTLRGKVIRVETVNSQGVVIGATANTATTEYPIMEFAYDDAGKLIAVTQYDEFGREVARKSLSYPADGRIIVEFRNTSSGEAVGLSADMSQNLIGSSSESDKSMINRQDNTYDEDGRMIRSMYYWYSTFHPACDNNGVYGKAYTYNDAGLIESISNLDQDGQVMDCRYGWATTVLEYDAMGNLIADAFYAAADSKAMVGDGYHGRRLTYDASGNLLELAYVNKDGELCNSDDDCARQVAEFDSRGFLIRYRLFNAQGMPAADVDGVHEKRYEYYDNGRMSRVDLLDGAGEPVVVPEFGYSSISRVYDEAGRVLENRMYDAQGNVLWVLLKEYEDGREVLSRSVDGEGNPILRNGYYEFRQEYDAYGNSSRQSYYGTDGKLILNEAGYAVRETEHDEFGNIVELRYYGADGKPCCGSSGFAVAEYTYVGGRNTEVRYFGAAGEPVVSEDGYHECRMIYNSIGVCVRLENYGTDGKLTLLPGGYAIAEQTCDDAGNVTEIRYFGTENEPVLLGGEYHKTRRQYDAANNMTHGWYYGTDGKLRMQSDGYAAIERDFDEYGDSIAWRYYGTENEPILVDGEYHEVRYQRDVNRQWTHLWYYGTDGKLLMQSDGYAAVEADYDGSGNTTALRYYGTENEPILLGGAYHEIRWAYDAAGNILQKWHYGTDGKLLPQSEGYAGIAWDYDAAGNITAERYYGVDEGPFLFRGEYHEVRWGYDEQGNTTHKSYYGTHGQLVMTSSGYAAMEVEYDAAGNITAGRYYGTENQPILLDGEYHEIRWDYDEQGNPTSERYYGTGREPILWKGEYHEVRKEYDPYGWMVRCAYFGLDGEPVMVAGFCHEYRVKYDVKGNVIRERYYDIDGVLVEEVNY